MVLGRADPNSALTIRPSDQPTTSQSMRYLPSFLLNSHDRHLLPMALDAGRYYHAYTKLSNPHSQREPCSSPCCTKPPIFRTFELPVLSHVKERFFAALRGVPAPFSCLRRGETPLRASKTVVSAKNRKPGRAPFGARRAGRRWWRRDCEAEAGPPSPRSRNRGSPAPAAVPRP